MTIRKVTIQTVSFVFVVLLLLISAYVIAAGKPADRALASNDVIPAPQITDASALPFPAPEFKSFQQQASPAALASTLSYYFISGNTFTPDIGTTSYIRQANGCVNQMPTYYAFSAPVHLPQASQVVSITLYTYNSVVTTTVSTAYFDLSDGKGLAAWTVSASSQVSPSCYQQHNSTGNNPTTIDKQNYNYYVQWSTAGVDPSPYLSLCGVRVAYYAPLGSTFLPLITK
jgi:hypothetical protein